MVSMAASTDLPFVLSLLLFFFFFVSCSRFPTAASSAEVPVSVSAKAAAVQYWNRVVGSDSRPPSVLLAHLPSVSHLELITQLKETGLVFGDEASDHATSGVDVKSVDSIRMVTGERANKKGDENYLYHCDGGMAADGEAREGRLYNYQGGMAADGKAKEYNGGRVADGVARENNYHGGSDDKHTVSSSPDATSMYGHHGATDVDMRRAADGDAKENHLYNYHGGSDDKHTVSSSPDATSMYGHHGATDVDMRRAADGDAKETDLYNHHERREADGVARENNYHGGSDDIHAGADGQMESIAHSVEGIFFRESQLTKGTTMPVADFGGERPHLNFLPRYIASKVPLSAVMKIFHIPADSSMGKAVAITINDCNRAPMEGETRRCITSAEDMIDYVVSSLGAESNVTARSTENSNGMGRNVLIGGVKAVNGGKLGHAVSCHQTMFPYLLYQCHSVPKTNLYEVEILDPETEEEINRATAICHFDTSKWSPGHEAFVALGSVPGTEVCHWIYPRNMVWTAAAMQ